MRQRSLIWSLVASVLLLLLATAFATPAFAGQHRGPKAHAASTATGPMDTGHSWSADFSTGNFRQWSWWGQGQQSMWGKIAVVKASRVGVPQLGRSQRNVASMSVTARGVATDQINAKLYEEFGTWRNGVEHEPASIAGTYSAWYYIPSSYKITNRNAWANIFQFKEQYVLPDGGEQSDPLWWVQLASTRWARSMTNTKWLGPKPRKADKPVAFLNYWGNDWKRRVMLDAVPINHWFEITATVYPNSRTVYSIAGRHFDTALASQYPVSPFHSTGNEWIFGVGNYATAPNTTLYVGKASYQPQS